MNKFDTMVAIVNAATNGKKLTHTEIQFANLYGFSKYPLLIALQQEAININDDIVAGKPDKQSLDEIMSHIMNYTTSVFKGDLDSDETWQACRNLFTKPFDTMSEDGLSRIFETVVPVAVMRFLLKEKKISFNVHKNEACKNFIKLYKDMIINNGSVKPVFEPTVD